MKLSESVIVITGAARGMGAATALAALRAGARVAALDLSWGEINEFYSDVGKFRKELEAFGDRVLTLEGDISSDADMDRAYEQTIERFGTVDALINNAALVQHHVFPPLGRVKVLDTTDESWEKMLKVNVIGTLKVTRRFIRPMIEKQRGSIINIVSSGILEKWKRTWSMEQPYMSCKAAIANMTWYLAHEVQEHNIAVNMVSPGHAEMTGWEVVDKARAEVNIYTPSSRQVPEHIVPLLLFLASHDASDGPTGEHIHTEEWNLLHGNGTPESWKRENITAEKMAIADEYAASLG